jgi:hypothetical protein
MRMDARAALVHFLSTALAARRERYVELASRAKTQDKFLAELYHRLAGCIDARKVVPELPADAWDRPAYVFAPPDEFGTPITSLLAAHRAATDACLLITADGMFAIHVPEDHADGTLFIKA